MLVLPIADERRRLNLVVFGWSGAAGGSVHWRSAHAARNTSEEEDTHQLQEVVCELPVDTCLRLLCP